MGEQNAETRYRECTHCIGQVDDGTWIVIQSGKVVICPECNGTKKIAVRQEPEIVVTLVGRLMKALNEVLEILGQPRTVEADRAITAPELVQKLKDKFARADSALGEARTWSNRYRNALIEILQAIDGDRVGALVTDAPKIFKRWHEDLLERHARQCQSLEADAAAERIAHAATKVELNAARAAAAQAKLDSQAVFNLDKMLEDRKKTIEFQREALDAQARTILEFQGKIAAIRKLTDE